MIIYRLFKVFCASIFTLMFLGVSGFSTSYASIIGSCDGYFDEPHAVGEILPNGDVIRAAPVPILRAKVNVYEQPYSKGNEKTLEMPFGHYVFLNEYRDGYFLVSNDSRKDTFIGWIHGDDILCNDSPLLNDLGIEKKFIPNMDNIIIDENMDVMILQSDPKSSACKLMNGRCQVLKHSFLYLVYAHDKNSRKILIKLKKESAPLGWVNIDNGHIWDTRHGLMPRYFSVTKESICFNKTLEDASSRKCFRTITGGNKWYSYTYRIPVLDRVNYKGRHYFHVIMPVQNTSENKFAKSDQVVRENSLTQEGYIEDNNHVQLDILVHGEEFRNWRSKLSFVRDMSLLSKKELTETFIKMLQDGLSNSARALTPDEMDMSIAGFLNIKHGLPTWSKSPLLNYTVADLFELESNDVDANGKDLIEVCELYSVGRWLDRHREIFDAIDRSEIPLFKLEKPTGCNMRYDTPELNMEGRERFPESSMSFRQVLDNEAVFWIPDNFLP